MKKLFFVLTIVFTQLFLAQSAKDIIDRNIETTGGLINWKTLNSVILSGRVTLGINDEYPMTIYQQRPNLTKTTIINKKETAIEGYDGKKGYAMNYATNQVQEYPSYVPESFDNDFIDWENKGFEAKFLGKEKVGNIDCFKVELTKNVNKTIYYFDTNNYFLVKEVKKNETMLYSDYRKVGNLTFAFRMENSSPTKEGDYVITLNKIEVNRVFPANTFKFK